MSTKRLTLPFSLTVTVLDVCIPLVGLAVIWLPRFVLSAIQHNPFLSRLSGLLYDITFLPFILAVVSLVYALPSDLRACCTEMEWERLFRLKNEVVIRSIQNQLHCCGFNSMHDRAWPFPSRDVDARACERNSGFLTPCGPLWSRKVLLAAVLSAIAGILNFILLVRRAEKILSDNC